MGHYIEFGFDNGDMRCVNLKREDWHYRITSKLRYRERNEFARRIKNHKTHTGRLVKAIWNIFRQIGSFENEARIPIYIFTAKNNSRYLYPSM